jgi:PAS domain S-box-containing protein
MNKDARILIVDGDPLLLRAASRLLKRVGYQVFEAANGMEGQRLAVQYQPELILLDVVLPDIDGVEICRRLKSDPALAGALVVLLLGTKTGSPDQAFSLESGADGYIVRPIPNRELLARVETFLYLQKALSERDAALESAQAVNERLAEKVAERTARLAQANEELQAEIAERKQAEGMLRQEKNFAESMLNTAQVIILVLDPEGRIVRFNPYMEEISGYSLEEVQGKDWFSAFLPVQDQAIMRDLFQKAISDIQTRGNVSPILTKGGIKCEIEWYDRTLKDVEGNIVGLLSIGLDITERKRAEEALRESEERYRLVQENSMDAILLTAPDGRILSANPAACKMFQRTEAEICQAGRTGLVDLNDPRVPVLLEERERTGKARGELTMLRSDGAKFPVELSSSVFMDRNGEKLTSMIIRDITERKRAEDALLESQAHLEEAQRIAHVGSWDWIAATDTPHWSRELCAILEVDPDKPVPSMAEQDKLYTPDSMVRMRTSAEKTMQTGEPYEIELERVREDGSRRWLLARGERWSDHQGQLIGLRGTALDITERKRAEKEIRQRAEQLAALNALGRSINATLLPEDTSAAVVRGMLEAVHPDLAFLLLREGEKLVLKGIGSQKAGKSLGAIPGQHLGERLCGLAVTQGEPLYFRDIFADARCAGEECKPAGFRSFAALPLCSGEEIIGVIGLAADKERDFETQAEFLETLASQVAVALSNVLLYQENLHKLAMLNSLFDGARQLSESLDIGKVAGYVARTCVKIFGARLAWLLYAEADGSLRSLTHFPPRIAYPRQVVIRWDDNPPGQGPSGRAIRGRQPVVLPLPDLNAVPDYSMWHEAALKEGFCTSAAFPLIIGNQPLGVLNLYSDQPSFFSTERVEFFQTFATQAAAALENARLYQAAQDNAAQLQSLSRRLVEVQEEDRRAIGRELHDEFGQTLTGLKILLEMALRLPHESASAKMEQAQALLGELVERVSRLTLELRPPMLDDLGLLPALLWHIDRFTKQSGIGVDFKHAGIEGQRFAKEIETAGYRIIQESLTNIARHAGVKTAAVQVTARHGEIEIHIEDRGCGFDAGSALAAGSGLSGMRERARLLGGRLMVESSPGRGTRLDFTIPLEGGEKG